MKLIVLSTRRDSRNFSAVSQFQNDVYGEIMDALYLCNKYVSPIAYDMWLKIRERLEWICENWQRPDAGIWEMRNREEHFTYSKVMNWVALDRGIRLAEKRALPANHAKWLEERDRIYEEVMSRGWNQKRRAWQRGPGCLAIDHAVGLFHRSKRPPDAQHPCCYPREPKSRWSRQR